MAAARTSRRRMRRAHVGPRMTLLHRVRLTLLLVATLATGALVRHTLDYQRPVPTPVSDAPSSAAVP